MANSQQSEMEEYEPNATPPKLSLSKLPNKPLRAAMPTPPSKLSIPFHWEEAPGKPRPQIVKNRARRLDLPPRMALINNNNVDSSSSSSSSCSSAADYQSPTTVLGGPEESALFSRSPTGKQSDFSVSRRSLVEEIIRDDDFDGVISKEKNGFSFKFTSWGSGSLKERSQSFGGSSKESKLHRFRRRRSSFASLSHASSKFLAGVYGSFKQVTQWRRRQDQLTKTGDLV